MVSLGDAHHITRPHNDGRGAILAMKRALEQVYYVVKCPLSQLTVILSDV